MDKLIILLLSFLCFIPQLGLAQDMTAIHDGIKALCKDFHGDVGVSVVAHGQTMSFNGKKRFPLMSLFKVPVAVAALSTHERHCADSIYANTTLLEASWLKEGTYSPLRDKIGRRDTLLSKADIVYYTVALSDNNTCDWLIDYAGGIGVVNDFWRNHLGLKRLRLSETEASMHSDVDRSYNNWATPCSVTDMLRIVFEEYCLSEEHTDFLRHIMESSPTGKSKLKAGLPPDVRFAHKTGLSDRLPDGTLIASVDAGIIRLSDGTDCYIAVLVKDTKENNVVIDKLMADVASIVWRNINEQTISRP